MWNSLQPRLDPSALGQHAAHALSYNPHTLDHWHLSKPMKGLPRALYINIAQLKSQFFHHAVTQTHRTLPGHSLPHQPIQIPCHEPQHWAQPWLNQNNPTYHACYYSKINNPLLHKPIQWSSLTYRFWTPAHSYPNH